MEFCKFFPPQNGLGKKFGGFLERTLYFPLSRGVYCFVLPSLVFFPLKGFAQLGCSQHTGEKGCATTKGVPPDKKGGQKRGRHTLSLGNPLCDPIF